MTVEELLDVDYDDNQHNDEGLEDLEAQEYSKRPRIAFETDINIDDSTMMLTTSEKALKNRYMISGVTASDNPLRELKIPEQLVVSYRHFRNHVIQVLQHVNQDFPKMQFDKCLNCWLRAGFCSLSESSLRNWAHACASRRKSKAVRS